MAFEWATIFERCVARRIGCFLRETFKQIDRQVEIKVVHLPGDEMQLASQLRPQCLPILLGIRARVITVLAHIRRYFPITFPAASIPERARIAILVWRAIDRFPRIELIAGSPSAPQHGLELAHLPDGQIDLTLD